ncbi:hypothetical protein P43SY_001481 [Pythium insidiosum]|uniref:START domain-containing protein n=1 Tax=Pythium insidiosum TaxID=114742 RepID=A0AAD5Q8H5_PYTIN|nr:hypothetical protein P43SY_001481 [Pythium insidiosum]
MRLSWQRHPHIDDDDDEDVHAVVDPLALLQDDEILEALVADDSVTASPTTTSDSDTEMTVAMEIEDVMPGVDLQLDDHDAARQERSIGFDAVLLREMEELMASSKEDWNHFQLSSPSLVFPPTLSPEIWLPTMPQGAPQSPRHHATQEAVSGENRNATDDSLLPAESREMELLRRQLKFLQAQREYLEFKAQLTTDTWADMSVDEQQDRQRAEQERARLAEVRLHQQFLARLAKQQLENLKYMELLLLQSPLNHYRMTLMTPMESYIHLTTDPVERRATLLSLRDEKIDAVKRFVEFQARSIDVDRQFFYLDTFEKFGKFYTVDFSINKFEDTTVDHIISVLYSHYVTTSDMVSKVLGAVENREYFDGVEWVFLNARFVDRINLPKRHPADKGFVVQESNTVYYLKRFGETAVLMSDYIDKDDLHPYRPSGRIRKDKTVGVVIEPYVDSNGRKSVVMKRFSFIRHHFKNIPATPELMQAVSTKVILWGQAVRFCISKQSKEPRPPTPVLAQQLKERSVRVSEMAR